MCEHKVELLSPAGNYEAFLGALHAGADAVYLSGERFGARAYADNFTTEELRRALRYAHLYGKKVYLTVNTLVKENEFGDLYDYLAPLYEAGLDGVIVQDLGVFAYVKDQFPELSMHISTQMTVTGAEGAAFLKKLGADRVVPARELNLQEILQIKERVIIEIECFIHGAMCYSYSGQCLFSSVLGGRSGNRGRCAQPCRLPYGVNFEKNANDGKMSLSDNLCSSQNNACYPISLKDMCTIEYIPSLMEAGIDSFKIEGRMKKPEYAAAVTALYRKYIDLYTEKGRKGFAVAKEDLDILKKLYIRSEIQNGYYERRNGREMITLYDPSYQESDEKLLKKIRDSRIFEERKFPVTLAGRFAAKEPAVICLTGEGVSAKVGGKTVEKALSRPMGRDEVLRQLCKTGNTHVMIENIDQEDLLIEEGIFIPVGQLNELRRNAVTAWENQRIRELGSIPERNKVEKAAEKVSEPGIVLTKRSSGKKDVKDLLPENKKTDLHVSVCTMEQLMSLIDSACKRIYLDSELFIPNRNRIIQLMEKATEKQWFLALPYMLRTPELSYLEDLFKQLPVQIEGVLVRNLEEAAWLNRNFERPMKRLAIITDAGLYCFNTHSLAFFEKYAAGCVLPYELNERECRALLQRYRKNTKKDKNAFSISMIVYGTIPMMISAGCLMKTMGRCVADKKSHLVRLTDRYKNSFPVWCHCTNCHNVIYNALPLSLHNYQNNLEKLKLDAWRLDFLSESGMTAKSIVDYYAGVRTEFPIEAHTTGHYKRGVE